MKEMSHCGSTNQFQPPATHAHWFPASSPVPYSGEHPSAAVPTASLHGWRERRKAVPFWGGNERPEEGKAAKPPHHLRTI
jgi:hypothetical protein